MTNPIHLLVASPIYNDQCYGSYTASLLALQKAVLQRGYEFTFQWTKNISMITQARNVLAHWFMHHSEATHLLFVDADMAFEAQDVMRMFDHDLDLMAAIYPRKVISWENVADAARRFPNLPAQDLAKVAGTFGTFSLLPEKLEMPLHQPFAIANAGTGLMLIRRHVFERLGQAYPDLRIRMSEKAEQLFPGQDYMHAPFETTLDDEGRVVSEDLSFCNRWRAIGGEVHGCAWFQTRHLGTYEYASDIGAMAAAGLVVR